jgi:hypothetical protein
MKLPKYQLLATGKLSSYEFVSEGPRGLIVKRIQFTLINREDVYNLAFGDKDPISGEIDDLAISNNGDLEKILATVISAVFAFCDKNPKAWIFATGSTKSRTRLYQIGISKYFKDMDDEFELYGQIQEDWELFENGKNYSAFLAKRKI